VLDIGTGTGIVAFELASKCDRVVGRDIYDEWLRYAREKAEQRGIENVSFDHGSLCEDDVNWRKLFAVIDAGGWGDAQEAQTGGGPQSDEGATDPSGERDN
jgi:SAM-dependent methyltransferase